MKINIKIFFIVASLLLVLQTKAQDDNFSSDENTTVTQSKTDDFSDDSDDEFTAKEKTDNDEFDVKEEASDDFEEEGNLDEDANQDEEFNEFSDADDADEPVKTNLNRFYWAIGILFFTILAGFFVRYKSTRKLRPLFLLASVVILGFYRGGPGIISSFQNTVLFFAGMSGKWVAIVLFLGVLVLTYFFGKVFCGWVCYLGAIQEFLHIKEVKILETEKAQTIMRRVRYVILAILIIQLIGTQTIEWSKIGPFKVIFNLYSPNITGYVLLAFLLISSLFIHRPFCKMVCPAGLIFGWVTKIPGAHVLGITNTCAGCKTCSISCKINAITRENKVSKLDNQECIMCGECMNDCRIESIKPFKNSNNHEGKIILKGIKKLDVKKYK
jgi:polyferredoxin